MNWRIDTHQITYPSRRSGAAVQGQHNPGEQATGARRIDHQRDAEELGDAHWPIAPGSMIRPLIVAE